MKVDELLEPVLSVRSSSSRLMDFRERNKIFLYKVKEDEDFLHRDTIDIVKMKI